jgi:hypothetical protein
MTYRKCQKFILRGHYRHLALPAARCIAQPDAGIHLTL